MRCGEENERFAKELIDLLVQQGVEYFCAAPGSRNTALSFALFSHPTAQRFVHFDERGLCFHALGYAKARRKPVAVIVTSGTAGTHLLAAVVEAHQERVPLILLTADRPPELLECGANQTCDQFRMFQNYTRWHVELPCPDPCLPSRYLATTIAQAVFLATQSPAGPVHLNCPFREPFFAEVPLSISSAPSVDVCASSFQICDEMVDMWKERIEGVERGVILAGSDSVSECGSILKLAEKCRWPIFADILSPVRRHGEHDSVICHFDPLLKLKPDLEVDGILQFGNRFVSKVLYEWLQKQRPQFYVHLSEHPMRHDPFHLITHRLQTDPALFAQKLADGIVEKGCFSPFKGWSDAIQQELKEIFSTLAQITEPGIFHALSSVLDEKWALFLGNSMPIRDANQFFAPPSGPTPVFANRGVSGIDGNIATAVGMAKGCQKPTLAILGDLAVLHDLNSLAQVATLNTPFILLAINNGGGGIFSFLTQAKHHDFCEEMIATQHAITFSHAASLFGLEYAHPETVEDLLSLFKTPPTSPLLIEVTTQRTENFHFHQQLYSCLSPISPQETPLILH